MVDDLVPIHSCHGTDHEAQVMRKTGLYASEQVCVVMTGRMNKPNPNFNALQLATMLCEALEAQRERDNGRNTED